MSVRHVSKSDRTLAVEYLFGHYARHMKRRSPEKKDMRCHCGYDFARQMLRRGCSFQSFAVVNQQDYQTFLKQETKVLRSRRGSDARLRAIARSSEYVGCLHVCPKCSRVLLLQPGASDGSLVCYAREDL